MYGFVMVRYNNVFKQAFMCTLLVYWDTVLAATVSLQMEDLSLAFRCVCDTFPKSQLLIKDVMAKLERSE